MPTRTVTLARALRGKTLEAGLSREPGLSPARLEALFTSRSVRIAGKVAQPGRKLWGGEVVELTLPLAAPVPHLEGPPVPVLYSDADVLVVSKPAGLTVEPEGNMPSVVALVASQQKGFDVEGLQQPGVVHRLDRETSGCLALAKTDLAVQAVQRGFEAKALDKRYLALVLGAPPDSGALDTPYTRNPEDPRRYTTRVESPRRARLSWTVRQRFAEAALLEVHLDTGRTHQIRVQLLEAGFPVLCDPLYGPPEGREHPAARACGRLCLHAEQLSWEGHFRVTAPMPDDLRAALAML
jgi:23S rRNA pseudouridine1911/1915/1917 synthase